MKTTTTVAELCSALLALRQRTGDATLSHRVKAGRFQLCRVVYSKRGVSTITPLSEYRDGPSHLAGLRSYLTPQ